MLLAPLVPSRIRVALVDGWVVVCMWVMVHRWPHVGDGGPVDGGMVEGGSSTMG